jgi:hypothetical protein
MNALTDDLAERPVREKNRWQVKWAEFIGPEECPLMIRWVVVTPLGSLRLHHFLRADRDAHPHDHPWWFATVMLKGGYLDRCAIECERCDGKGLQPSATNTHAICLGCGGSGSTQMLDRLRRGSIRFRPALHRHWVETENSWTLVVTGRIRRSWGFWDNGLFRPVAEYFRRYGYAPCEE